MKNRVALWRMNARLARVLWGRLPVGAIRGLKELSNKLAVSVAGGDVQFLEGRWYVTHSALLRIAERRRCVGIKTNIEHRLSDPNAKRFVFRAVVYKTASSRGFVGYGDADPSNVTAFVRGAEMRIAETRAVNRALRKAYGIGLCSIEELGSISGDSTPSRDVEPSRESRSNNGACGGQPRLRDQLCVLIRQYNLDPTLVKAYAADFCGTQSLKDASRDRVQSFISHITVCAKEDRDALVCRLNSYAQPEEVAQ